MALDTVTYPDAAVSAFLTEHLVPVRLCLEDRTSQAEFRARQIIWTPTLVFLDRRGVGHYTSPGYLPPADFHDLLHIGVARCLMAWSRYSEASTLLAAAADRRGKFAPEALYWQGMADYLPVRKRAALMVAWGRLREQYPDSPWTARVPPGQDEEEQVPG